MSDDISVGTIEVSSSDPVKAPKSVSYDKVKYAYDLLMEPPHHRPPQLEKAVKALKEALGE